MATVTLKDIKKSFGSVDVIHDISVDIADGEFIVIVGPSGCGKSTLLRMVAGLETVTSGEVLIGGELANEKEPMDRDIAMVFQNYALYPHMSVRQNMGRALPCNMIRAWGPVWQGLDGYSGRAQSAGRWIKVSLAMWIAQIT